MKKQSDPDLAEDTYRILKEIGLKIKAKRKMISSNYENFARDHNFNKVTIARMESGENFNIKSLIEILQVLNISLEDFFQGIK